MKLKPLRETMVREAAYYCWVKKIETINANGWDGFVSEREGKRSAVGDSRGKGGVNSLERLTEGAWDRFVQGTLRLLNKIHVKRLCQRPHGHSSFNGFHNHPDRIQASISRCKK